MSTVMLSVGDASGDVYAGDFVRELARLRPGTRFLGMGGAELAKAGMQVVVDQQADRDIYVAAAGGVIKVSGDTVSTIDLGFTPSSLNLDSDLRTAIPGVEPGQVDHGVLWAAGGGKAAVIDTDAGTKTQEFAVSGASSVSVDFPTQYAYVANGSSSVAVFAPSIDGTNAIPRPPMAPRIWSSEEVNWNGGYPGEFQLMATGDPLPTLSLSGLLPEGLTFVNNGDGTATVSGTPTSAGRPWKSNDWPKPFGNSNQPFIDEI